MADADLDRAVELLRQRTRPGNNRLPALTSAQILQLRAYLAELLLWRQRVALISTEDPELIVEHHVIDSLELVKHLSGCGRIADIGSGAGFPGVPLAVALPEARITLIESRRKKANFLRTAKRAAQLSNAEVIEERAEALSSNAYDAVTSRALGSVEKFLDLAAALLPPGGLALAMRGLESTGPTVVGYNAPEAIHYELARGRRRTVLLYRRA